MYHYISPTCVFRKFAADMSHCPSKLNNATNALPRVFISPRPPRLNNEQMHCHGLLKKQSSKDHPTLAPSLYAVTKAT